ncbi:odorant receptor coreceptor-like [Aphidius gifuensis]|uniref:odorant receptor coreceptor-like n=1 Tax=Aphidius gifuensis TaxID=684658 RepID=UPI001CDC2758|nr:odorant receptor coreceptor-like [Aphidius gifuensis]
MSRDCFLPFAVLGCFFKSLNIVGSHDKITYVIQTFLNDPCLPRNSKEILIQKKYDKFIWRCTVAYGVLAETTAICFTFGSLWLDLGPGVLPFPAWLPYKHDTGTWYWFAYSNQIVAGINSTTFAIGYDTLIPSLMIQIVSKFEILQHILNIDKYQKFSQEWTGVILYLCCMLSQIFILCAAGNEVTLVSSQLGKAVYSINWTHLNKSTIKSLILIMNRSLHPIVFTSKNIVTLSLDSFKSLIKISYSTYNVLHRT